MIILKKYKDLLKIIGKFFISLFIYLIIITIFAYFNIISYNVVSVLSFIFMILLFLISGFKTGKISEKKGFISGLFIGIVITFILLLLSLIFKSFPTLKSLLYFFILIISSVIGGMIGINKKN